MNGGDDNAEAAFTALFAARSTTERVRMMCGMFDAAKALVAAGIRAEHPDISAKALKVQMFDRLYVGDFDAATRARIVAQL